MKQEKLPEVKNFKIVCQDLGKILIYTNTYDLGPRHIIGNAEVYISPDLIITRELSENLKNLLNNSPKQNIAQILKFYPHLVHSDDEANSKFPDWDSPLRKGIGTKVLEQIIEDSRRKDIKGVFCTASQRGMEGFLRSRNFQCVSIYNGGIDRLVDFYLPM